MTRRFLQLVSLAASLFTFVAVLPAGGQTSVSDCTETALREAIAEGGLVTFDEPCVFKLTSTIVITNDVILDASDLEILISGNNSVGLFLVAQGASLELTGLTLTNGNSTNGGAVFVQAGGQLIASECTFIANHAAGAEGIDGANGGSSSGTGGNGRNGTAGGNAWGGAIYNEGDATLTLCQFVTNSATGGGGGNGGNGGDGGFQGGNGGNGGNAGTGLGGAVYHAGTLLEITNCTFEANVAVGGSGGLGGTNGAGPFAGSPGVGGAAGGGSGAAIFTVQDATIASSTFSRNAGTGGNSAAGGTLSNSNGSNGSRGGDSVGGGIFNGGTSSLENCTFFGNSVKGGNGGNGGPGDFTGGNGGNGGNATGGAICNSNDLTIVNCTIANCSAVGGTNGIAGSGPFPGSNGSPGKGRGGGAAQGAGLFSMVNSILSTNNPGTNFSKLAGEFTDDGHNISSDASFNFTGTSKKNTNPRLAPLADNDGPTKTMALNAGSPAIDAGDDAAAPATDQRGIDRPSGAHSDIGAFELIGPPPVFQISGRVLNGANGLAGVKVAAGALSAVTDSNGFYNIPSVQAGDYFVFASLAGFDFGPAQEVTIGPSATNLNFTVVQPKFTVSGRVTYGTTGLSGVSIFGAQQTDSSGNFSLPLAADTYTFTPFKSGYRFQPASRTIVVTNNVSGVDFIAGAGFTGIRTTNGTVTVSLTGPSGAVRLQASTNLIDWETISTNNPPFQFVDTNAANFPQRFYRSVKP
jgi:hypothetical protein